MADSRSRTTLNLSGLSDRIEQLRSDTAWKALPLSKKVMLLLEEYLTQIESGQVSDVNITNVSEQSTAVRDRITFDIKDLRERLESASTEPEQSIASVLRWVAILGLDILDACRKLQIPSPRLGDVDKWLIDISTSNSQPQRKKLAELISALSLREIEESLIPLDRIVAIKEGEKPTQEETTRLARLLGLTSEEIRDLLNENLPN